MTTKTRTRKTVKTTEPERLVNNDLKVFTDFPVPIASHQGDLTLVALPELPKSAKPRTNRQLADGNTQGSRHVLAGTTPVYDCDPEEVAATINRLYRGVNLQARYVGPVFTTPALLEHPEHGHQRWDCEGVIAVTYQRNQDAEEREVRTRD